MSKWVNVDVVFQRRAKIFEFLAEDFKYDALILFARLEERDLRALESIARSVVLESFPQLAFCEITYLAYDYRSRCFEIGVSHPSLPEVPDGEYLPRERVKRKEME